MRPMLATVRNGFITRNVEDGETPIMKPMLTIPAAINTFRLGAFLVATADTKIVIGRRRPRAIYERIRSSAIYRNMKIVVAHLEKGRIDITETKGVENESNNPDQVERKNG